VLYEVLTMGVVVAAHHVHLDEKVAIKFLLPEAVTSTEVVGRFVREARAAVRSLCDARRFRRERTSSR
jgi:serine/threonine protein kinase